MKIENTILRHIVHDESYARKVIPFIKPDYFKGSEKLLFENVSAFLHKYNALPSIEALLIEIDGKPLAEGLHKETIGLVQELRIKPDPVSQQWLIDETEKFCQDRAIFNAIKQSIEIIDGKSQMTKESLPDILKAALAVSFDASVGHDFLEDFDDRFDYYHRKEEKIPFDLEYMNKITRGGLSRKSLNIILAGTGVGKTLAMCHFAAANLMLGKKVLYITMEMAEEKIAQRIDANLLNVMLDELEELPKDAYEKKVERVRRKTLGKLIIKEYPTASAHVGHFRHLINELHLKRDFVPDIIYVDYLNICMSARIKPGSNVNSYTYIKSIAEELRGLAVEHNIPIVSATQTTRSGYDSSDPSLTDTSESFGLPATADFMMAMISNEDLQALNQVMFKQLKNRYADPTMYKRFVVGVDRARMKLYDVDESAQEDIMDDNPVMDKSNFGERQKEDDTMGWATKVKGRRDFSGLKTT